MGWEQRQAFICREVIPYKIDGKCTFSDQLKSASEVNRLISMRIKEMGKMDHQVFVMKEAMKDGKILYAFYDRSL